MELTLTTQFATIPEIITYGDNVLRNFRTQVDASLSSALNVDIVSLTDDQLKSFDDSMAAISDRAIKGKEHVAAKRMPITRTWNESVLKKFTAVEGEFESLSVKARAIRNNIAKEVSARRAKLQMSEQLKQDRATERNYYLSALNTHLITAATSYAKVRSAGIVERFFAFDESEKLEKFVKNLASWNGAFTDQEKSDLLSGFTFNWQFHNTKEEQPPVATQEELSVILSGINSMYFSLVATTRDSLVQYAPERILELKSGISVPDETIKKRIDQFIFSKSDQASAMAVASVKAETAANNVTAAVESAEAVAAGVNHGKGVKTKRKLVPTSHAHWQSIIRHYVDQNFAHLSIAEIEKKFSFMLKSVQTNANSTDNWPLGVPTEEDFSIPKKSRE